MATQPIIMYDSPEAASVRTVTGWVNRHGQYYGNDDMAEHLARWSGCTHKKCECGAVVETRGYCRPCHERSRAEAWAKLPLVEWDGETPFCEPDGDHYWFDAESFYDWCELNDVQPSAVRLVLCVPEAFREVDPDYWQDDLPEDGEIPDDIQEALDALNAVIAAHKEPACWRPGKKRIVMPDVRP